MIKKISLSLPLIALFLHGCTAVVKTPYQAPNVEIPALFQHDHHQGQLNIAQLDQWWTVFNDPKLNQLIMQVLARNSNLAVAGITLKQARLTAGLKANQQGIRVGSSISTGHSINLGSGDDTSSGISLNRSISYEVDLFGKLAKQTEASQWEATATEQDLQATAQTIIGDTIALYWKLAYLNEQTRYVKQNIVTSQKLYQLVKTQYHAGAVSGLDLVQAEQAIQSQQAKLSQIKQQQQETRAALAVLLHQTVLQFDEPTSLDHITLPDIQAGLPAVLLSRRPDLKASEYRLRKALANKDATKASFYPSISLTGVLGSRSVSLTGLIKNPILTLGANLNLPFVQLNDMKKEIAYSNLEYEKVIIQYRQTLYQAFVDVENALSARTELNQQVNLEKKNLELVQKTQNLTEIRYRHGAIALKSVLDAQQNTRSAYLSWLQAKYNQYNAYVTLLQALGGSPIKEEL